MMNNKKKSHPSHPQHPLKMSNREGKYTCDGCKMEGIGPRYRCNEGCNYDLHHECMRAPPKLKIEGQKCRFLEKPPPCGRRKCNRVDYCTKCRSCDACGMTVKGFVYHCSDEGWDFHPRCAKLESKIIVGDVTFWLEKQGPSSCAWCKKNLPRGAEKRIPGWSYVSKYDDYNFHVHCVMEMAMKSSSMTATKSGSSSSSSTSSGISINLPLITKSNKGGSSSNNKWLEILKIFLRTVFSILLGDPTAILASTAAQCAHLVTYGFNHHG